MLNICADCTTAYAADLTLCPHCGSERREQHETDPYRGDNMPKITRYGGPTIAGEQEPSTEGQGDVEGAGADAPTPPADEPDVDDTDEAPPDEPAGPSNADIRAWAAANDVEVSPSGPIPKAVREAYDTAHAPTG